MTKAEAVNTKINTMLQHSFLVNYEGDPIQYRVVGSCKTFKGMPEKFLLPTVGITASGKPKEVNKYTLLHINENNKNLWRIL